MIRDHAAVSKLMEPSELPGSSRLWRASYMWNAERQQRRPQQCRCMNVDKVTGLRPQNLMTAKTGPFSIPLPGI
jgi:hypothetical protein